MFLSVCPFFSASGQPELFLFFFFFFPFFFSFCFLIFFLKVKKCKKTKDEILTTTTDTCNFDWIRDVVVLGTSDRFVSKKMRPSCSMRTIYPLFCLSASTILESPRFALKRSYLPSPRHFTKLTTAEKVKDLSENFFWLPVDPSFLIPARIVAK